MLHIDNQLLHSLNADIECLHYNFAGPKLKCFPCNNMCYYKICLNLNASPKILDLLLNFDGVLVDLHARKLALLQVRSNLNQASGCTRGF